MHSSHMQYHPQISPLSHQSLSIDYTHTHAVVAALPKPTYPNFGFDLLEVRFILILI